MTHHMRTKRGRCLVLGGAAALVVGASMLGAGLIVRGAALERLYEETEVTGELAEARGTLERAQQDEARATDDLIKAQAGAQGNLAVARELTDAAQTMSQADRGRVDLAVKELSALVSGDYTSVNDYIDQQNELARESNAAWDELMTARAQLNSLPGPAPTTAEG